MNIIEAMESRRSVRTFNGGELSDSLKLSLVRAVEESFSPFGGKVTIRLKNFALKEGFRPSTYGMIKGASDFFLIGIGDDDQSALSAGFRFEQVVLKAWMLGLGTCWIAATFRGTDFDDGEPWPDGERLKIISPVGISVKPAVAERLVRMVAGSDKRKPFDKLFFYGDLSHKIPDANRFRQGLEMMRLAPSSTNSQPWRALVDNDIVHFYCVPESRWSMLDCGIGLCHFYMAERYYHSDGSFLKIADAPAATNKWIYVASYRPDRT